MNTQNYLDFYDDAEPQTCPNRTIFMVIDGGIQNETLLWLDVQRQTDGKTIQLDIDFMCEDGLEQLASLCRAMGKPTIEYVGELFDQPFWEAGVYQLMRQPEPVGFV